MSGAEVVFTKTSLLPPEVKQELEEARNGVKYHLFVPDSSIFEWLVAAMPLIILGLFAWGHYDAASDNLCLWTATRFPEYALLYSAFFAYADIFLLFSLYRLMTLGKHGYALTRYGLLKLRGSEVTIFPFECIRTVSISQVTTTSQKDDSVMYHDAYTFMANVDGQDAAETMNLPNKAVAQAFLERFESFRDRKVEMPAVQNKPFMPLIMVLLIIMGATVLSAPVVTLFAFFPYHNAQSENRFLARMFQGGALTAENLTRDRRLLQEYLFTFPTGPHSTIVREKYRTVMLEAIAEKRRKVLQDPFHRYEYSTLLHEFGNYVDKQTFATESLLLNKDGEAGVAEWRIFVEGKAEAPDLSKH